MKSNYIKTIGRVVKVHKCWWIKVNTKPVRKHAWDGAMFPHIITVEYEANGQSYTKRKFLNYNITCSKVCSNVDVYYDKEKPSRITLSL